MSASELDEDLSFPFPKTEPRSQLGGRMIARPDYLIELRDLIEESAQKQEDEYLELINGIYKESIWTVRTQITNLKSPGP